MAAASWPKARWRSCASDTGKKIWKRSSSMSWEKPNEPTQHRNCLSQGAHRFAARPPHVDLDDPLTLAALPRADGGVELHRGRDHRRGSPADLPRNGARGGGLSRSAGRSPTGSETERIARPT